MVMERAAQRRHSISSSGSSSTNEPEASRTKRKAQWRLADLWIRLMTTQRRLNSDFQLEPK